MRMDVAGHGHGMEDMHTALAMRVYNVCLLYFRARVAVGIEGRNGLMGNERDRRCPSNSSSKTQRMPPLISPPRRSPPCG